MFWSFVFVLIKNKAIMESDDEAVSASLRKHIRAYLKLVAGHNEAVSSLQSSALESLTAEVFLKKSTRAHIAHSLTQTTELK